MILSLAAALALSTQATVATDPALVAGELRTEAGYGELESGRNEAAITRLEQLRDSGEHDAAILINLGVAYERANRDADAREAYTQAMQADEYELELADGSWHSSRDIADVALRRMDGATVALR